MTVSKVESFMDNDKIFIFLTKKKKERNHKHLSYEIKAVQEKTYNGGDVPDHIHKVCQDQRYLDPDLRTVTSWQCLLAVETRLQCLVTGGHEKITSIIR